MAIEKMYKLEYRERFEDASTALEFICRRGLTELWSIDPVGTLILPDGSKIIMSIYDWKWEK